MDKTSELIVERIAAIRKRDARSRLSRGGFSKQRDGRWGGLEVEGTHISELDFSELAPDQLIYIFELIISRLYTQR